MAQQRSGPRPASQRGDVTGMKARALAEENESAVDSRRAELGTVTHAAARVREEGVIDLTGESPVLEVPKDLAETAEQTLDPAPEPIGAGKNINNGSRAANERENAVEVLELPEEKPRVRGVAEIREEGSEMDPVMIRVLFDLPDTTLGIHNTMSFLENRKYRLPRWMGEHLVDRGVAQMLTHA